ncbi:fluoride efflux transporter CrcB [Aliifodinibius salipaludis]|uniref:Fluoride-specific ion channel FluC n=1 Tax=Fodinibius salipaludis TaxID=2032627 RepID=A0A2A2G9K7_9BACT|nr:fluoride efflux transporter CrcB [Aliifodinibius salipaludis]PAU94426.1 fluoride efflux transporter CrcB [Aliifodinibius salipaludis]
MLQSILAVGAGGFFGSIFRYLISHYITISAQSTFPFGTLTVNLAGSFLIGIIIASALEGNLNKSMRLLLATGFCGGFTTFSSFSYEFFSLLQHEQTGYAFLYAVASFVLGLAFVWLGFSLVKV